VSPEAQEAAEEAVGALLAFVGEDPGREGLQATPRRVCGALAEMTAGAGVDIAALLGATFGDVAYDEMIVVQDIEFVSLCEHHLLPFTGTATVGYVPRDRVVGISKLARLVDAFARRLQIQERMTSDIAGAIAEHLDPLGVGVVVRAEHSCMACRGVRKRAPLITSAMLGVFRDVGEARAEFLALTPGAR
jgi:GTP cyclohydrolase I